MSKRPFRLHGLPWVIAVLLLNVLAGTAQPPGSPEHALVLAGDGSARFGILTGLDAEGVLFVPAGQLNPVRLFWREVREVRTARANYRPRPGGGADSFPIPPGRRLAGPLPAEVTLAPGRAVAGQLLWLDETVLLLQARGQAAPVSYRPDQVLSARAGTASIQTDPGRTQFLLRLPSAATGVGPGGAVLALFLLTAGFGIMGLLGVRCVFGNRCQKCHRFFGLTATEELVSEETVSHYEHMVRPGESVPSTGGAYTGSDWTSTYEVTLTCPNCGHQRHTQHTRRQSNFAALMFLGFLKWLMVVVGPVQVAINFRPIILGLLPGFLPSALATLLWIGLNIGLVVYVLGFYGVLLSDQYFGPRKWTITAFAWVFVMFGMILVEQGVGR